MQKNIKNFREYELAPQAVSSVRIFRKKEKRTPIEKAFKRLKKSVTSLGQEEVDEACAAPPAP